jgi:hypothetical protein
MEWRDYWGAHLPLQASFWTIGLALASSPRATLAMPWRLLRACRCILSFVLTPEFCEFPAPLVTVTESDCQLSDIKMKERSQHWSPKAKLRVVEYKLPTTTTYSLQKQKPSQGKVLADAEFRPPLSIFTFLLQ